MRVKEEVLGNLDLGIIGQLYNFAPDVEAHYSKLALSFSIDFEVGKRHTLSNFSHLDSDLFATHYLVTFEIVILLHPKFIEVLHLTVEVQWMREELLLIINVGLLYFTQLLWFVHCRVKRPLGFVSIQIFMFLREENSRRVVATVNNSR